MRSRDYIDDGVSDMTVRVYETDLRHKAAPKFGRFLQAWDETRLWDRKLLARCDTVELAAFTNFLDCVAARVLQEWLVRSGLRVANHRDTRRILKRLCVDMGLPPDIDPNYGRFHALFDHVRVLKSDEGPYYAISEPYDTAFDCHLFDEARSKLLEKGWEVGVKGRSQHAPLDGTLRLMFIIDK